MSKNKTNEKRSKQLGMNFSTASNRLKKKILFMLVKRVKMDECYQCKKLIVDHEDLSVEHKKPWLDEDTRLFWDMGNIAFSHRGCNAGAARFSTKGGRVKYEKWIGIRDDETGHYISRTWYDRGCRCEGCKRARSYSRRKHEREKE